MKKFIAPFVLLLFGLSLADITVNDDTTGMQTRPDVKVNDSTRIVVSWTDSRTGTEEAYFQILDSTGTPVNVNTLVASSPIGYTHVAIHPDGHFVFSWDDYGDSNNYFQIFNKDGSPRTVVKQVNTRDSTAEYHFAAPAIINPYGNITMAWYKLAWRPNYNEFDVLARHFDSLGNAPQVPYQVNIDSIPSVTDPPSEMCDIAEDNEGNYVIVWQDQNRYKIYYHYYDASGTLQASGTVDDTIAAWPRVSMQNGRIWIVWHKYNGIYLEGFNTLGAVIQPRQRISGQTVVRCDIAHGLSGQFVAVWCEMKDGDLDMYARKFDSLGNALDTAYRVVNTSVRDDYPTVTANDKRIVFTWQSFGDIFAKAVYWPYPALRGNCNGMGKIALDDVIYLVNYILRNGPVPKPFREVGDVNCDGNVTMVDILRLAYYVLGKGPQWTPCGYEIF